MKGNFKNIRAKASDTPCIILLLFAQKTRRGTFEEVFFRIPEVNACRRWRENFSGGEPRMRREKGGGEGTWNMATIAMHLPETGNKLPSHDAFMSQPTRHSPPPFSPPRYSALPLPSPPPFIIQTYLSIARTYNI